MEVSQGTQANLNGHIVEQMLIPLFEASGFVIIPQASLSKYDEETLSSIRRYVITNAKFTSIYNSSCKSEFVVVDGDRRIRIESKYQANAGSVDEKFPYMLLNGIYAYPEVEIIFIVDGGGYRQGAFNWLKECINGDWLNYREMGKTLRLFGIAEFINWFNHEFATSNHCRPVNRTNQ